jgi:hypothetical protein
LKIRIILINEQDRQAVGAEGFTELRRLCTIWRAVNAAQTATPADGSWGGRFSPFTVAVLSHLACVENV